MGCKKKYIIRRKKIILTIKIKVEKPKANFPRMLQTATRNNSTSTTRNITEKIKSTQKKYGFLHTFFYFLVSTKKICKCIFCFSRNVQIFTFKSILNISYISAKAIHNIFDCRSISACVDCINNCHNST